MKKTALAFVLAVGLFLMSVCGGSALAEKKKYSATRLDLFDTVISLTGYADSEAAFNEVAQAAFAEFEKLHRYYDVYNEYEGIVNICTLNLNAGGNALKTDPCVIDLLKLGAEIYEKTGGRVDAVSGSVLRLWHDARTASLADPKNAYIPDMTALVEAKEHIGFDRIEIDEAALTVRLDDPEARIDVGATAKGYAAERVARLLPEGYLLSAGGNVVATSAKPDGTDWTVGVQDPDDPQKILLKLNIHGGAVVTSGDYQRVYEVDGVRYHHIIDLETCMPSRYWRSVSVICPDSGIADGLSTALFVLPIEEGAELLKQYGAEALWVDAEGNMRCTKGFEGYIVK